MGTHCSSEINRGHISKSKTAIMKLLLLTIFVAAAFAVERKAVEEAKPEAPKAVVPVHAVHPFHGLWGHQLQWPGIRAPGFSATCFGCRGKRSAEAEADAEPGHYGYYGYYGHPYGYYGYPYHFGYRAFAPIVGKPAGAGVHPGGATSFVSRSPQGLGRK